MMRVSLTAALCALVSCGHGPSHLESVDAPVAPSRFVWEGNSLTWDTRPHLVSEAMGMDSEWHIHCGRTLPEIADGVDSCLDGYRGYTEGPTALVVQPFRGWGESTLRADIDAVFFLEEEHAASEVFVLCPWPRIDELGGYYAEQMIGLDTPTTHSLAYCNALAVETGASVLDVGGAVVRYGPKAFRDSTHLDREVGRTVAALAALRGLTQ